MDSNFWTRRMLVYILLSIITGFGFGQDPCSDEVYTMLPDLPKRSPSFSEDWMPLCDRYLPKRWYRAGGSHQIPTTAPDLFSCGTLYPYWMNGSLPSSGNMATVKMCQTGFASDCVRSHTIRIKNCGIYSVYELIPVDFCNSAYCFEPSTTCVDVAPAGVSVTYHNVTWETIGRGKIKRHTPAVNLICNFLPLNKKDLFYDISWYVDDTEVLRNQTVTADEKMNAILSAEDILKANKKAGSMIHCVVGAKIKATGHPCITQSSPLFFAGIKVWPTKLEIRRGRSAKLYLELTVPFADQVIDRGGKENISILFLTIALLNDFSNGCRDKVDKSVEINNCDTKIPAFSFSERNKYTTDEWKRAHEITVHNMDNADFSINKHLTLRLKTAGTGGPTTSPSRLFDSIFLQDVPVQIIESSSVWKGKTCQSRTDPHLYPFDTPKFTCMLLGTFILYRNELYNQEVQEKHFSCYPDVTCNCAAAVRSGRDIFTIDVCRGGKEIIHFPLCDDKILKVMKTSDLNYRVVLPTGTIVEISIITWNRVLLLNILITASLSDVGNTRGLCGILDGRKDNDFLGPDNSTYQNKDAFATSWLVSDNEDLLNESNTHDGLKSISKTLTRVCSCLNTTGEWRMYCNYGSLKDCKFNTGKQFFCFLSQEGAKRRKRDLTYLYSKPITEESSNSGKLEARRNKRNIMMSLVDARNACLTEFEKSISFKNCEKFVSNLRNSSLGSCILDLRFTGDVSFTAIHLEAALEQCSTYILLNSTFQQVEKEITHQIQSLCPSNCSGNGVCIKGNCTCNPRYAGSDCSFDLFGPPTISLISNFGFCDKSEENCDEITLYGRYFLENMNTRCYTTRRRITENGSYVLLDYFQRNLEERTLFEGYCPLEYGTTPTWVTYFTFNISNDGKNFTENYNVYTYQSLCQEYHNDSGKISFTFKNGYCFIDGRCFADGESNPKNKCDVCKVAKDRYSWTFNEGHCYINGTCIAEGEVNITNPCEICNTANNVTSWSISSDFCVINNICYFDGEKRENNDCEICNIDKNRYEWTYTEDGYCLINGHCVREGEHDSKEECYVCKPKLNIKAWSIDSDGYCFINGSCVPDGEHGILQECKVCNPASKIDDWSFDSVEDTYCFINGRCVLDGERDTLIGCNICNTAVNKNDWSIESGCILPTTQTSVEFTPTESAISTTEELSFTTDAESSASRKVTTELTKSMESSKTPVSTALVKTTMTKSTARETTTTKTQTTTAKAPKYIEKVTTKTGIEPTSTSESTTSDTTAQKTTSTTKANERDQAAKESTTMKISKNTLTVETSTTLTKTTEPILFGKTTNSIKTNPTAEETTIERIITDPVTNERTTKTTEPYPTAEPTTITETRTNQFSKEPTTIPKSTEKEKPTLFKEEEKATVPKTTSSFSTESTHLTKFTEDIKSISTCCTTITNKLKSPKSPALRQYTVLAVSLTAPIVFVLVIIVIACVIHYYRRSHATMVLGGDKKASYKMDMKRPYGMRQTKKESADEVFSDSEFGVSSSGNKYSKFSEEDHPFST